jgi:hypothetical protein
MKLLPRPEEVSLLNLAVLLTLTGLRGAFLHVPRHDVPTLFGDSSSNSNRFFLVAGERCRLHLDSGAPRYGLITVRALPCFCLYQTHQ